MFPPDPRSRPARRPLRSFRPDSLGGESALETRLALASGASAIVSQAATPRTAALAAWNRAETWAFIDGGWSSTISVPFVGRLVAALGGRAGAIPSAKSVDAWRVSNDGVTMTPGDGVKAVDSAIGGLAVRFDSSGAPIMMLESSDGSPPVALRATSASRSQVVFRGEANLTSTEDGKDSTTKVPVSLTVTRVSARSFQFTLALSDGSRTIPFMNYRAKRMIR